MKHTNSTETIKRITAAVAAVTADYRERLARGEALPAVTVSGGNSKIGGTLNVSTAPVVTCSACAMCGECAVNCYAVRACARLGLAEPTKNAWIRNTALLAVDRNAYFCGIVSEIEKHRPAFFRWHVSGEVVDGDYFRRVIEIAGLYPETRFLIFSKAYKTVSAVVSDMGGAAALPVNLAVLLSAWRGTLLYNPCGLPECHVAFGDGDAETFDAVPAAHRWQCLGDCTRCQSACCGCWFQRAAARNADGVQDITIINIH